MHGNIVGAIHIKNCHASSPRTRHHFPSLSSQYCGQPHVGGGGCVVFAAVVFIIAPLILNLIFGFGFVFGFVTISGILLVLLALMFSLALALSLMLVPGLGLGLGLGVGTDVLVAVVAAVVPIVAVAILVLPGIVCAMDTCFQQDPRTEWCIAPHAHCCRAALLRLPSPSMPLSSLVAVMHWGA